MDKNENLDLSEEMMNMIHRENSHGSLNSISGHSNIVMNNIDAPKCIPQKKEKYDRKNKNDSYIRNDDQQFNKYNLDSSISLESCSSFQLPQLSESEISPTTPLRKKQINTPYTGFRAYNVKGYDIKEFINYEDWVLKNLKNDKNYTNHTDRNNLCNQHTNNSPVYDCNTTQSLLLNENIIKFERTLEESSCFSSTIITPKNELETSINENARNNINIGNILNGYSEMNVNDSMMNNFHSIHLENSETLNGYLKKYNPFLNSINVFGENKMLAVEGRLILMIYKYKNLIATNASNFFDKPSLMLDIKSDVEYKIIIKILKQFATVYENKISITSSSSILQTNNASGQTSNDIIENSTSIEIYFYHIVFNTWRLIKNKNDWFSAVLISMENNSPLKIMVTKNKKQDSIEIFTDITPKAMSTERMNVLTQNIGKSKELLSLISEIASREEVINSLHQSSSRHLSKSYDHIKEQLNPSSSVNKYSSSHFNDNNHSNSNNNSGNNNSSSSNNNNTNNINNKPYFIQKYKLSDPLKNKNKNKKIKNKINDNEIEKTVVNKNGLVPSQYVPKTSFHNVSKQNSIFFPPVLIDDNSIVEENVSPEFQSIYLNSNTNSIMNNSTTIYDNNNYSNTNNNASASNIKSVKQQQLLETLEYDLLKTRW